MHHQTSRIQGRAGTKQRMTACIDALGLLSSMTTGQHGNEKHGHQKGNQQRRHDSQPQIAKNLPSHSLHKHHRKEDANGCQSRCNDSPSDFPGPPHGSHAHVISFLTTSINGLRTTMEESTNIPIPMAKPPRDMMFRETSNTLRGAKVTATEIGMLRAMMSVVRRSRRNKNNTRIARAPPTIAMLLTSECCLE